MVVETVTATKLKPCEHICERCGEICTGPYPYWAKSPEFGPYYRNHHPKKQREEAAQQGRIIKEWCYLPKGKIPDVLEKIVEQALSNSGQKTSQRGEYNGDPG